MKILNFDTCLDKMYIALGDEKELFSSKIVETTETAYHSAFLVSNIKNILKENGLTPKSLDVVATNIGPGSFTGIRACTTVARVMGQSLNLKTVGASSLEILSRINQNDQKTLVALDARKEMAYVAIYDKKQTLFPPQAILIEDLKKMMDKEEYTIITDNKLKKIIGGISYLDENYDLGNHLLEITREKIKMSADTDWRNLLPLYIQPPAVTVKKQV